MNTISERPNMIDVMEHVGTHSEMYSVSQLNMHCLKVIEARLYG